MRLSQNWKLLVLEDDLQLREILVSLLEEEGYDVVAVDNGAAAVEMAAKQSFDLIITDIRMDGLDGLDALEQARKLQPKLSSLVVSGYTSEAETLRALQLNVGGFLKKPFSLGDLLQRVGQLLGQRRQQQQQVSMVGNLRRSLWWSLETGLRAACNGAPEAGALAFHLATQLGLAEEDCYACRLAAMFSMLESGPYVELPPAAYDDAQGLGPVANLVQEVRKSGTSPLSLPAQVAQAAHRYAVTEEEVEPDPLWDQALRAVLEAEGPQIRTAPGILASQAGQEHALGLAAASRHRGLLGLALTLEDRADFAAAQRAYLQLEADPEASQETRLRAMVGRARALFQAGDAEYYEVLKDAERQSRQLGPVAGVAQRWSIASLLLRSRHPSAESYLAQLEQELRQVGSAAAWARGVDPAPGTSGLPMRLPGSHHNSPL